MTALQKKQLWGRWFLILLLLTLCWCGMFIPKFLVCQSSTYAALDLIVYIILICSCIACSSVHAKWRAAIKVSGDEEEYF